MAPRLPEQIYETPEANLYAESRVGVYRFTEPSYAQGMGRAAAETIREELLRQRVFREVVGETDFQYTTTNYVIDSARSKGYDLVVTGDLFYYFEGSSFQASRVEQQIRVLHVETNRTLWLATAVDVGQFSLTEDFALVKIEGVAAPPATLGLRRNAEKFVNMLNELPPKEPHKRTLSETVPLFEGNESDQKESDQTVSDRMKPNQVVFDDLHTEVDHLTALTEQLRSRLREEIEKGEIQVQGDRTKTVINIGNRVLFDSGSAVLREDAERSLSKVTGILDQYPDNHIRIEGHTDSDSIHTERFPSNWELSTARALAVLRFFERKTELDPERLSATGYGEYHPVAPNDSPENKKLNRRVEIVVLPG
jgi:flagellar motor protein MotB